MPIGSTVASRANRARRSRVPLERCVAALKTIYHLMLGMLCMLALDARGQTVTFQNRNYDVIAVPLATTVAVSSHDLIFVRTPNGQKFLAIPSDPLSRGDFDIASNQFFMLDNSNGNVESFSSINATMLNLDGTVFNLTDQSPSGSQAPLQTIFRPFTIVEPFVLDVCIVNDQQLGYRVEGNRTGDEKIYLITREPASSVQQQLLLPIRDATRGFVDFDTRTSAFLLTQPIVSDLTNEDTTDRIVALSLDGTQTGELILEDNTALPLYAGNGVGVTTDPDTGTIFMLDSASRLIFIFTLQTPTVLSATPNSDTTDGGANVTITGDNFPADVRVFFGDVEATNVTVLSSRRLRVIAPPHAEGIFDIRITGTGIIDALVLPDAFTFVRAGPGAVLNASPTFGSLPLTVSFSTQPFANEDQIVSRVLNFGDGSVVSIPVTPGFSSLTTTHTYTANGTFTATLTVISLSGARSIATQTIVAGNGGITPLDLQITRFNVTLGAPGTDSARINGSLVLPAGVELRNATLCVGFGENAVTDALSSRLQFKTAQCRATLKPISKRRLTRFTHTFSVTIQRSTFVHESQSSARGGEGTPVNVFVKFTTEDGQTLNYERPAVPTVRTTRRVQ
jgi:PKD repeat protein